MHLAVQPRNVRLGLIMKPERFILDRYTVASTSYLIRGILDRFECELITSQADYRRHYDELDVLLSLEPKFAASRYFPGTSNVHASAPVPETVTFWSCSV